MKKVILFLIVIIGLASLEPRSRAQMMKLVRPVTEAVHRRSAERALKRIATDVQETAAQTGHYPQPHAFGQWLTQARRSAQDPWGSGYYLEVFPDSFVVGSPGPDARRRTADDLRLATQRAASAAQAPTATGLLEGYTEPAPTSVRVRTVKPKALRDSMSARSARRQ